MRMKLFRALQYSVLCWIIVSIALHLSWREFSWAELGVRSLNLSLGLNTTGHIIEIINGGSDKLEEKRNMELFHSSVAISPEKRDTTVEAVDFQRQAKESSHETVSRDSRLRQPIAAYIRDNARPKSPWQNKSILSRGVPWMEFARMPPIPFSPTKRSLRLDNTTQSRMTFCSSEVEVALTTPLLADASFKWCQWALSRNGGDVKVGKSYGKLSPSERSKYEQLQCNTVAQGTNPSCDDIWGERMLSYWKSNVMPELCTGSSSTHLYTSKVKCIESVVRHRLCTFENALFDFSKMRESYQKETKGRRRSNKAETRTREFDSGFLSTHCEPRFSDIDHFPFYSPTVEPNSAMCSVVFEEPVVAFSHDDLRNLGHSMSDIMNVWTMLWLTGLTGYSQDVTFLNIDSFRGGHNFDDNLFDFGLHYEKNFARVLKASDLAAIGKTICFKKLVLQPKPLILFTWDGWWQDMPCTFVGPSSLYQRWNLQIRDNYGLLSAEHMVTNKQMRLLFISRRLGAVKSYKFLSRVIANEADIIDMLSNISNVEVISTDLAAMSFEEQVQLISTVSIVIGMHGAGIANSMHMPVGSRYCCGVIEIFPDGEFKAIKGYGNMARKMGHAYSPMMLDKSSTSVTSGSSVDIAELSKTVQKMIRKLVDKPTLSCVLPKAVSDPYFDSYPPTV